jgi:hypothetical protein
MSVICMASPYFSIDMKTSHNNIFPSADVIYLNNAPTSFINIYNLPFLYSISPYTVPGSTSLLINLYHPGTGYFKSSILQHTWPDIIFEVTVYI